MNQRDLEILLLILLALLVAMGVGFCALTLDRMRRERETRYATAETIGGLLAGWYPAGFTIEPQAWMPAQVPGEVSE